MSSANHSISTNSCTVSRKEKLSDDQNLCPDGIYVRLTILMFLLLSDTLHPPHIIARGEKVDDQLPGRKSRIHHLPSVDHKVAQVVPQLNLWAVDGSARALQRDTKKFKLSLPFVNSVDRTFILPEFRVFKRGGPKLKRLGQVIHRNSRRLSLSLLCSHLSLLRSGLDERTHSLDTLIETTLFKKGPTPTNFLPSQVYLIGSFLVKYFVRKLNEETTDGNSADLLKLASLVVDQCTSLKA